MANVGSVTINLSHEWSDYLAKAVAKAFDVSATELGLGATLAGTASRIPTFGTDMRSDPYMPATPCRGMALGTGEVYCYEHGISQHRARWVRDHLADTE